MLKISPQIERLITLALEEDLAFGDATSAACIDPLLAKKAQFITRQNMILCGTSLVPHIISLAGSSLKFYTQYDDSAFVRRGEAFAELQGSVAEILALERTILNFLQKLCGISTYANELTENLTTLKICDTRKTTPGWRVLEKYAVKVGGANNHRFSLSDMILVKDNHIDACGDIRSCLEQIYLNKAPYIPVEVEVRDYEELRVALEFSPNVIMLDNMTSQQIIESLQIVSESGVDCLIEVSGGITPERLQDLEQIGVSLVSMGALTQKSACIDISLQIES